jgi:hypothetical protein
LKFKSNSIYAFSDEEVLVKGIEIKSIQKTIVFLVGGENEFVPA